MSENLLMFFVLMSLVLFVLMYQDKSSARRGGRRISENRLFLYAALGGAFGGCIAMLIFRHKTRHMNFVIGFPLLALLHTGIYLYLRFFA